VTTDELASRCCDTESLEGF